MNKTTIIAVLILLIVGSIWLQRPEKTPALKLADLKTLYLVLPADAQAPADAAALLPVTFAPATFVAGEKTSKGAAVVVYSEESRLPTGIIYTEVSVAQLFDHTLKDEHSHGIVVNPGADADHLIAVSDGDIITANQALKERTAKPFVIKRH